MVLMRLEEGVASGPTETAESTAAQGKESLSQAKARRLPREDRGTGRCAQVKSALNDACAIRDGKTVTSPSESESSVELKKKVVMTDFAKTKDLAEQISNAAATIDEESQHAWFVGLMSRVSGLGNEPLSSAVAGTLLYRAATYPEVFCSDKQAWAVACAAVDNNVVR